MGALDQGRLNDPIFLFRSRRTILIDQRKRGPADQFRQFHRICNGSRAAEKLRRGLIIIADPFHTAEEIGQVRAEGTPVAMQFIDHYVFQIGKNKIESVFAVVRKKRRVQHFRIGQDDIGTFADPAALCRRSVSVVYPCRDPPRAEVFQDRLYRPVLVAGKRLGRIDKHRSCQRVFQNPLQNRQEKAECLAAGG